MNAPSFPPARLLIVTTAGNEENEFRISRTLIMAGVVSFVTHRARGTLPGCPCNVRGVPRWQERLVFEAVVPEPKADEVFRMLYEAIADGEDAESMVLMGTSGRAGFLKLSPGPS